MFGRKCKIRDCTQNSSNQQVSGEVETRFEVLMPPKNVASEHCRNHNVAGFSLEFERVDDSQGTKRHNCELECENGGKRDWSEEATVDGSGPVVETLARDRSPLDPEVQHERSDCHRRTNTQLGRPCDYKEICAKTLRCRGLQWWRWRQLHWKEVEKDKWSGPHPERFKIYRRWICGISLNGSNLLKIVAVGDSL